MKAPVFVPIKDARAHNGLRLVLTAGVPGPWTVAARAIFDIKGIDYTPVAQIAGDANEELVAWTGHNNAPTAMLDDERPRTGWAELLLLAERLAPEPALIPASPEQRALMWGMAHEICGEQGLGWCARIILFIAQEEAGMTAYSQLKQRYSSGESVAQSAARLNAIIGMFERQMERQTAAGSDYLIGDSLTAVDVYWTAFSNLLHPMDADMCEMPDYYREIGSMVTSRLDSPTPAILLDHRNRTLRRHMNPPIVC